MNKEKTSLKTLLDGARIGGYSLILGEEKQLRLSGWRGIKLFFRDPAGQVTMEPVVEGIYSRGNGSTIKPWMDVSYRESLQLEPRNESADRLVRLADDDIDAGLFALLGSVIPPGGHLMVSYEGSDPIHRETLIGLYATVPPSATPLGLLLFDAGFHYVKDWYLAEGGHEGPRKLWGEKASDEKWEGEYLRKTKEGLVRFLQGAEESKHRHIHAAARERAKTILQKIENWLESANQKS